MRFYRQFVRDVEKHVSVTEVLSVIDEGIRIDKKDCGGVKNAELMELRFYVAGDPDL